jgi:ABC-type lipopolysaccharide export system ATPase subunit
MLLEPFSGIGISGPEKIIVGRKGISILFRSQRAGIFRFVTGLCCNKQGTLMTPEHIAKDKIVREVYLGEEFYINVGA